ncbi:hypothetical protein [Methylobacterium sp. 17Sr1-1]|uniref:hypothetical protein n=1 Tax=Methylobacterium sp. 17Sr1-1 TaxID=2202826 RepID=UPI000D6FE0C1|nr:hypothetical protein [Methylobacterium sp. 17Sr1-1]AWN55065.1 hypothetical protein DK412_28450 [Methylobacterium sp. 17Sr1-1]
MLKLSQPSEPFWLDVLPGVRIRFRPITVASMLVAREVVGHVFRGEDQDDIGARANIALVRELARRGIMEWEGIGDTEGQPIPVTREAIDLLMENWPAYDQIDNLYVAPALARDAEKNASSSSSGGTSAEAPNTATPAA